jgi:hypothetical protein
LKSGEYIVERDINVRPGGKLILQPGVTLRFPPAVGMMVAGKLDARGRRPSDILFTLKEELVISSNNETFVEENITIDEIETVPVRLLGGKTSLEGRLQVNNFLKMSIHIKYFEKYSLLLKFLNYFFDNLYFVKDKNWK